MNDRTSAAETAEIFRRLRALKGSLGFKPNKEDMAIVLIVACIEEGMNTGTRIVRALTRIGLNGDHVAIVLKSRTDWWSKDERGIYTVNADAGQAEVATA